MIAILCIRFLIAWTGLHPLHVSVTDMVYDEKEKELEVVCRIFTDDLETALRKESQLPNLDLLNPADRTEADRLIKSYVLSNMRIQLDGKNMELIYLGYEYDNDAVVCYIQVPVARKWKKITVQNTILHRTFDDQSNLVHVTVNNKIKSLRLMPSKPVGSLEF